MSYDVTSYDVPRWTLGVARSRIATLRDLILRVATLRATSFRYNNSLGSEATCYVTNQGITTIQVTRYATLRVSTSNIRKYDVRIRRYEALSRERSSSEVRVLPRYELRRYKIRRSRFRRDGLRRDVITYFRVKVQTTSRFESITALQVS